MTFPADFLPLLTHRLVLRRFAKADLDRFMAYRHDSEVAKFQSWSQLSVNEAELFIAQMSQQPMGIAGEWFQIAIAQRQSNLLIGDIGLHLDEADPTTAEIGFTLTRKEQGKGYAHEAIQSLLNRLFELNSVNTVISITDARNQPSINLLTRLNMNPVSSEAAVFKGEQCIEQTYELTKEDWLLRNPNGIG